MTDDLQPRVSERGRATDGDAVALGTRVARRPLGPNIQPPKHRGGRALFVGFVIVLAVGAASVWTYIAREQLSSSILEVTKRDLAIARRAFDSMRVQSQASLQSLCRIMVEDPRLKSTLATEGMDAATVADILKDLGALRRSGFLMVLSPEGRVFAEAGAPELKGLDLSDSSVVKKAQSTNDAIVGSWVLGGKVMDLAIMAVRFGESLNGFLVVGQPVDDKLLGAVADQTGVALASALANKIVLTSSKDAGVNAVFARIATEAGVIEGREMSAEGGRYLASVVDLHETAQSHRLVLVASLGAVSSRFERVEWLVFAPPVLVLVAVLLSLTGMRSRRTA
jgi:hypothetical protein